MFAGTMGSPDYIIPLAALLASVWGTSDIGGLITDHTILKLSDSPYLVSENINITDGATLKVEGGVVVKMAPGRGIDVHGDLVIKASNSRRARFTLWDDYNNTEEENSNNYTEQQFARLYQTGINTGMVEVYANGRWNTICDERVRYLDRNKDWSKRISKVICRDVGYAVSDESALFLNFTGSYFYGRSTIYTCSGDEEHVVNCTSSRDSSCNMGLYRLHVRCSSVFPGQHWGGIAYHTQSRSYAQSMLQNADIEYAGVKGSDNGTQMLLVPAVHSTGGAVNMSKVTITHSAGHGVMLEDLKVPFNISDVIVTNSTYDGILITTILEEGHIDTAKLEGNRNGLRIVRSETTDFADISSDICSVNCIRCQHEIHEFPLRFRYFKAKGNRIDCTKTFSTVPGYVLLLRPITSTYHVFVTIRDGANTDSPVIYKAHIATGQFAQPMPSIVTSSNSITIRIQNTNRYRYDELYDFELLTGVPGSFGMHVANVIAQKNSLSGIHLNALRMPITFREIETKNNTDGLHLFYCGMRADINGLISQNNTRHGIYQYQTDGYYNLSKVDISHNNDHGLKYENSLPCNADSAWARYAAVLIVELSKFTNNTNNGVNIITSCRGNFTFRGNVFLDNNGGIISTLNYNLGNHRSDMIVNSNTFANMNAGLYIYGRTSLFTEIDTNTFTHLAQYSVKVRTYSDYFQIYLWYKFYMRKNVIRNSGTDASIVYIRIDSKDNDKEPKEFNITDNIWHANSIISALPHYQYRRTDLSAALYVRTNRPMNINNNTFENPNIQYQLAVGDANPFLEHDARFNNWGKTHIDEIANTIYAYHHQYTIAKVNFHPYYVNDSRNQSFIESLPALPSFVQGHDIGGILSTSVIVLSETSRPYKVNKDIIIRRDEHLIVQEGVTLEFQLGLGIKVYGQLSLKGSEERPVKLTASAMTESPNVRLDNGPRPSEGFVRILHNNVWKAVCYNKLDANTATFLCAAVGGDAHMGHESRSANYSRILEDVTCLSDYFANCTTSGEPPDCSDGNFLYLSCKYKRWTGIHFTVDVQPSVMEHVDIDLFADDNNKAARSGILIDYLNNLDISFVKMTRPLDDGKTRGITIVKSNAFTHPTVQNVNISVYDGYGVVSYDSRIHLKRMNIQSQRNGGSRHSGIYIKPSLPSISSLTDDLIKPLCYSDVHNLDSSEVTFFRLNDQSMARYATCALFLTAPKGFKIVVQVIAGVIPACGSTSIRFHNGFSNETEPEYAKATNPGSLWVSNGNQTHIALYRGRFQCLNIIVRVSASNGSRADEMMSMTNSSIDKFNDGLFLEAIWLNITLIGDVNVSGIKRYGVYLQNSGGNLYIKNSRISTSAEGFRLENFRGNTSVTTSHFSENDKGISVYYGAFDNEKSKLHVDDCVFSENNHAYYTKRYYHYRRKNSFESVDSVLTNTVFAKNKISVFADISSTSSKGLISLKFLDNVVDASEEGIIFYKDAHTELCQYDIQRNIFRNGGNGRLLDLRGFGNVSNNQFTNWTTETQRMIQVRHYGSDCNIVFDRNIIEDNRLTFQTVFVESRCENLTISNNTMRKNLVQNRGLVYSTAEDALLKNDATFYGNVFSENIPSNTCEEPSFIQIQGHRKVHGYNNVLNNPQFHSEVRITQETQNHSSVLNFTYNYWGISDQQLLSKRIIDGYDNAFVPMVNITPYFTSPYLNDTSNLPPKQTFKPTEEELRGRLEGSYVLSGQRIYHITSDLIIPENSALTVEAGSTIIMSPISSIYTFGKLNIAGTKEDPVKVKMGIYTTNDECVAGNILRLGESEKLGSGRLEMYRNGKWGAVCYVRNKWGWQEANIACKQLGFGKAIRSSYRVYYTNRYIEPHDEQLNCLGHEEKLEDCQYSSVTCGYTNPVNIHVECSQFSRNGIIELSSRNNSEQSTWSYVDFEDLNMIQVSGTPPILENVKFYNVKRGLVYMGAGISKEIDVQISNSSFNKNMHNALSLYDITSNVTLESVSISQSENIGVFFSPGVDGSKVNADADGTLSTFRFCDLERTLMVYPGEEYRFFKWNAQKYYQCRRVFMTTPGNSIRVFINAATSSSQAIHVADFFEGDNVLVENRISQFSTKSDWAQVIEVQSWGSTLTVLIVQRESFIVTATVSAVPGRANDCSFEEGLCGWHNLDDPVSPERGTWIRYPTANNTHGDFGGMARDVTFPGGQIGHYIFAATPVGLRKACSSRWDGIAASAIDAVLLGPELKKSFHYCYVTFAYFRTGPFYRGDRLTLYAITGTSSIRLWSSTSHGTYDRWTAGLASLDKIDEEDYKLMFHVRYISSCKNAVGIDDIKFNPCKIEKLVSTISLTDVRVKNTKSMAVSIQNNDPLKHNIVWIERTSLHNCSKYDEPFHPAIQLRLKSAYVLLRNTDVVDVNGRAIDITFDSETDARESEVTLTQNSVWYSSQGGVLHILNSGITDASVHVYSNDIRHNVARHEYDILQFVNVSLYMESNVIFNNTGAHILQLGSDTSAIGNILPQRISNNTFWFNIAQRDSSSYTIYVNATDVELHQNIFNNPANMYDFSAQSKTPRPANLNCINNWWGSGQRSNVKERIRSSANVAGLPDVTYYPHLAQIPPQFGISSSCPVGWQRVGARCMLFRGGAVVYTDAKNACLDIGATLLTADLVDRSRYFLHKQSEYRDIDGTMKNAVVWIAPPNERQRTEQSLPTIPTQTDVCLAYIADDGSGKEDVTETICNALRPYVCQKLSVVLCKNSCFQNGICYGRTCLCNSGWRGEDCSEFICHDVNDCYGRGECVGPNQCKCRAGWLGRACTKSYCARFQNCKSCTIRTGCGWCDSSQTCVPGNGYGADVDSCPAWFYYKCFTMGSESNCSNEIEMMQCDDRYCNVNNTRSNIGLCQACEDVAGCFTELETDLPVRNNCRIWDEYKCPNGKVVPDYSNPKRVENIVYADNFIYVDPSELMIYYVDVTFRNGTDEASDLVIVNSHVPWLVGQVISSSQAGGVFIKITSLTYIEESNLTIIVTEPAAVEDAIKYIDVSDQEVPMQLIEDPVTVEQVPQFNLLEGFLNGTLNISDGTIAHELQEGENIFKCIGREVIDNSTTGYTTYTVVPMNDKTKAYKVGDIVVSYYSDGFLETVKDIIKTSDGEAFVFTELTQCSNDPNKLPIIISRQGIANLTGFAGNNWPGLSYYEEGNNVIVKPGDTFVGREADAVFGKILAITEKDSYLFLELIPVEAIEEGKPTFLVDVTTLRSPTRRKRGTASLSGGGSGTLSWDGSKKGATLSVSTTSSLSASISVTTKVDWDWFDSTLVEAGWNFKGGISCNLKATVSIQAATDEKKNVFLAGSLGSFRKSFPFVVWLVPGRVFIEASGGYRMSASARGSLKASRNQNSRMSVGGKWTKKHGYRKTKPPTNNPGTGWSVSGKVDGGISVKLSALAELAVQWPLWFGRNKKGKPPPLDDGISGPDSIKEKKKKKKRQRRIGKLSKKAPIKPSGNVEGCVGDFCFETETETEVREEVTSIEAGVGLPVSMTASASGCNPECRSPDSKTRASICAVAEGLRVRFSALYWNYNVLIKPKKKAEKCLDKCYGNLIDCCICTDEDGEIRVGQLDKDGKCRCPCFCDPPKNTIPSVKSPNGQCECKECPNGQLERWWADIKCPCTCPEEPDMEKEMKPDKTCGCECDCGDGKTRKLDENGDCPCDCTCKNCQESVLGPDGCICPGDVCPECEAGAVPQWINCSCECPEFPCGIPPVCVTGRTGPACDVPECSCQSCGNGVCRGEEGSCASNCACSPGWLPPCCDRPDPDFRQGDPHLDTIDGLKFDYFGIGQYWDCLSERNDFGLQVRYYYYEQTSFTGAVALKAGESVVSLTTPNPAVLTDMPTLRIDGAIKDLKTSYTTLLSNGLVKMDITSGHAQDGDMALVLISFQYKSDVKVSFDVRFSPKISRQYVNIQFSLNKMFRSATKGLCGFMDDDQSNDFMGPTGEIYDDVTAFAESWKIEPMTRPGGGLQGSWSWTESNFHIDDTVDITYTDPNFTPKYSLQDFNDVQIYEATLLCAAQGVKGTLLDGCIYDVVITNDTTFVQQEVLQAGCPNACNGKGRCVASECVCAAGWSGDQCEVGACGSCFQGLCESGFCVCDIGWEGVECSRKATCYNVNNCTDMVHGQCSTTDHCLCNDGYIGTDCSIIPTCLNAANCTDHGICVDYDVCKCNVGYQGFRCDDFSCESLNWCSNRGVCGDFDVCICAPGWQGFSCSLANCEDVNDCSGFGTCEAPNTCKCADGYFGVDCSLTVSCPKLNDCNDQGLCVSRVTSSSDKTVHEVTCRCDIGYTGDTCSEVLCESVHNCSSHGRCIEPNLCSCDNGYTGTSCSIFSCDSVSYCSGHGECIAFDTCKCDSGWTGDECNVADCSGVTECSSQGFCVTPGVCQCYDGFQGEICDQQLGSNEHDPIFNQSEYAVSLKENAISGQQILQVFSSDEDAGKNGQVFYSLDLADVGFDIGSYLTVDSTQGNLSLVQPITRDLVPSGELYLQLVAFDQGIPSRSSVASLKIEIIDINDHCPVFTFPPRLFEVGVNSSTAVNTTIMQFKATDEDWNENGMVTFAMSNANSFNIRLYFLLDKLGNLYSTVKPLPVGRYEITVIATDMSMTPCSTETKVMLLVYPTDLSLITTTTTMRPTTTTTTTRRPTTTTSTTTTSKPTPSISATTAKTSTTTSSTSTTGHAPSTTSMFTMKPTSTTPSPTPKDQTDIPSQETSEIITKITTSTTTATTPPSSNKGIDLLIVIVGAVLGGLLLIFIIVIIALAVSRNKYKKNLENINKQSKYKERDDASEK